MNRMISEKTTKYFMRTWQLYGMLLLPIAFFIIFRYLPMTNIVMAFKNYNMFKGVWESEWAGFVWFNKAFTSKDFWNAFRNTLVLNALDLVIGFPMPILMALLLNELIFRRFKRVTQTIAYLPHFLSWIIITGIAFQILAPRSGIVNIALTRMGFDAIEFLSDPKLWIMTYVMLGLWKEVGWNAIIYLAAITGINPELYESAEIDGAGRFRKIWHVTLPGIRNTIVVLLILSVGRIVGIEFDRPFTLQNTAVMEVADVISTYVYRVGIKGLQFSLTAAVGLFQSVINVIFLLIANELAKRTGEHGIW
ncbi:MAG TPA: sugar ABC transporter permease [Clostridiales bacterium]|nr:sugar ABC transporter permease [Clostridiales bacterium]